METDATLKHLKTQDVMYKKIVPFVVFSVHIYNNLEHTAYDGNQPPTFNLLYGCLEWLHQLLIYCESMELIHGTNPW